eukprot:scaffold75107_cov63-Phaeocystis_antarctica.AAC.3
MPSGPVPFGKHGAIARPSGVTTQHCSAQPSGGPVCSVVSQVPMCDVSSAAAVRRCATSPRERRSRTPSTPPTLAQPAAWRWSPLSVIVVPPATGPEVGCSRCR